MAVRSVSFDAPDGGAPVGVDLDGVCSCVEGAPGSCTPRPGAQPVCDDPGGIDDVFDTLLRRLETFSPDVSRIDVNGQIARGDRGMLVELRGYNGAANDTTVFAALYVSGGVEGPDGGAGSADGGVSDGGDAGTVIAHPLPQWDGNDRWTLTPESLVGGTLIGAPVPVYADENAYVRDGMLVARLATDGIDLGVGAFTVSVGDARFVGKLVPEGSGFRVDDGVMVGRLSTRTVLTALAVSEDPFARPNHLCGASATYQVLKGQICGVADIMSTVAADGTGMTCDALSFSVQLTASPAKLGGVRAASPPDLGNCGTTWTDDCQ
jgi:hypothetical protein